MLQWSTMGALKPVLNTGQQNIKRAKKRTVAAVLTWSKVRPNPGPRAKHHPLLERYQLTKTRAALHRSKNFGK